MSGQPAERCAMSEEDDLVRLTIAADGGTKSCEMQLATAIYRHIEVSTQPGSAGGGELKIEYWIF